MAKRIIVNVKNAKSLNNALKEWKRRNYFLVKELRSKKEYEKPSDKKRKALKKRIRTDRYLRGLDG